MTTTNEPLVGIQARIEELQNTIAEKEEQIKTRARKLKEGLQEEISPTKFIRRHPFETVGTSFLAGLLITTALRSHRSPSAQEEGQLNTTSQFIPTQGRAKILTSLMLWYCISSYDNQAKPASVAEQRTLLRQP